MNFLTNQGSKHVSTDPSIFLIGQPIGISKTIDEFVKGRFVSRARTGELHWTALIADHRRNGSAAWCQVASKYGCWGNMSKVNKVLRLVSLSILFGGSAAVVFVAVILVKAAVAKGIPVSQAAAINAPAFIEFSKVAAGAAIALLLTEAFNFATQKRNKLTVARYVASFLCIAATFVFAFGIVPPMKELQPFIGADQAKAQEFHKLHEVSRGVFGGTILFALFALAFSAIDGQDTIRREQTA